MTNALEHFAENYMNLFHFFVEFTSHFKNERSSLRRVLQNSRGTMFQTQLISRAFQFIMEKGAIEEIPFPEFLAAILPDLGVAIPDDSTAKDMILLLAEESCIKMGLSEQEVSLFVRTLANELPKNDDLEDIDFEDFFFKFFKAGMVAGAAESGTDSSIEEELPKNISELEAMLEELLSDIDQSEPKLLYNLYSACTVQLWSIFEAFLKDAVGEIAIQDLSTFNSGAVDYLSSQLRLFNQKGSLRNAQTLFERALNLSFLPTLQGVIAEYNKIWPQEFPGDHHRTVFWHLEKLHLFRNDIVHNKGILRKNNLKYVESPSSPPQRVPLTDEYVKSSFSLIKGIVVHLSKQLYPDE